MSRRRNPGDGPSVLVCLRLSPEEFADVEARRGDEDRGAFIRRMVFAPTGAARPPGKPR